MKSVLRLSILAAKLPEAKLISMSGFHPDVGHTVRTSVVEQFYSWLSDAHGCDPTRIHNRTYVGRAGARHLLASERKRLRHTVSREQIDARLQFNWADAGPRESFAGHDLAGRFAMVIDEGANTGALERLLLEKARKKSIQMVASSARTSTFGRWILDNADRPDHIGDFCADAKRSGNFPQEADTLAEVEDYLPARASHQAVAALRDAWAEYCKQKTERG